MTSQKGFVTVWMIGFLPLLLAILAFAAAIGITRLEYSRKLHVCRTSLLEAQQDIARAVNQLIALNPTAKKLRIQRRISDEAVRSGLQTIPYLGVAVSVHRAATLSAQYALKARQDYIRFSALNSVQQKLWSARNEILKLQDHSTDSRSLVTLPLPKLKMHKTPEESLTPDYYPSKNFELVQALKIRFYFEPNFYVQRITSLSLVTAQSDGSHSKVQKSSSTLWADCSATIKKEGDDRWYPTIAMDKF